MELTPQPGIFETPGDHHHALEFVAQPDVAMAELGQAVHNALKAMPEGVRVVTAFSPDLWQDLASEEVPVTAFETIEGKDGHRAPATQGDLFFWVTGDKRDDVFDGAMAIGKALSGLVTLQLDLPGFCYHNSRDLSGFEDGTANPKDEKRYDAAVIPAGQPGAGGSVVLSQRWVHNLPAFHALDVTQQEKVIGRTKPDSIELEGDDMPADSHVSRTDVKVDGVAQKIFRRSFPYGGVGEHGLYFLCFACAQSRISIQLDRMWGLTEDGLRDHLLDFSHAVTGSYWYAPPLEKLAQL